jgi:hypothetical protein
LPGGVLRLPRRLEAHKRARGERRPVAQQAAQRQLEISERQAVQVEVRQQRAHFQRAALEEREQPAHKPVLEVAHARPAHGDRAAHQRELPRPAVPVARAGRRIDRRAPCRLGPAQQLRHFILQELLNESLHVCAREGLERIPRRS